MPRLQSFTDEQRVEIQKEIDYYLRPLRLRFWGVIIGLVVGGSFGLYTYTTTNARLNSRVCQAVVDNRTALSELIALSVAPRAGETAAEKQAAARFASKADAIINRAGRIHCP